MSKRSRSPDDKAGVTESLMVVEPDVLVRMTVAGYLRECGYRVVEAITGEEALSILAAGTKIDTIFTAVKLQGSIDGFGLAQRIRRSFPDVEIVLTTGLSMTAKKAGELCGQGPLGKPYHPELVVKRLKLLFQKQQRSTPG